jgi:hypothetical protein
MMPALCHAEFADGLHLSGLGRGCRCGRPRLSLYDTRHFSGGVKQLKSLTMNVFILFDPAKRFFVL